MQKIIHQNSLWIYTNKDINNSKKNVKDLKNIIHIFLMRILQLKRCLQIQLYMLLKISLNYMKERKRLRNILRKDIEQFLQTEIILLHIHLLRQMKKLKKKQKMKNYTSLLMISLLNKRKEI